MMPERHASIPIISGSTKFTIIVPTRERAETLHFCLKTLLKQKYTNFEVLVSDNFSQDETSKVVTDFKDNRIRYLNTGKRLSMSHNWEFALSHVKDGWVLFVGDDDGLLPGALSLFDEVIRTTGCEALTTATCTFWWPKHFSSMIEGELTVPLPPGAPFELKDSASMLHKVMSGQAAYRDLPWIYNGGAAKVNLLMRLRDGKGIYFRSLNPDIYSAISLALSTRSYVRINVPISVNGASKHSGGTSHMLGQKSDQVSPTSKFLAEGNIPFHSKVVFGKSFQIMAYECYLQAAHLYAAPKYELADQLKTALVVAPSAHFQEVFAECKEMAERSGIVMPGWIGVLIGRMIFKMRGLIGRFTQCRAITVPAAQLGAWNVDLASDAANHIYGMFDHVTQKSYITKVAAFGFSFLISVIRYVRRIRGN